MFRKSGFYLLDAAGDCPLPVDFNTMKPRERRKMELERRIEKHLPALLKEIDEVARPEIPIVLVVKRSGEVMARLLEMEKRKVVNPGWEDILPFPSYSKKRKEMFQGELRRICRDKGIVLEDITNSTSKS